MVTEMKWLEETEMWQFLATALTALLLEIRSHRMTTPQLNACICMIWSVFAWKSFVNAKRDARAEGLVAIINPHLS